MFILPFDTTIIVQTSVTVKFLKIFLISIFKREITSTKYKELDNVGDNVGDSYIIVVGYCVSSVHISSFCLDSTSTPSVFRRSQNILFCLRKSEMTEVTK